MIKRTTTLASLVATSCLLSSCVELDSVEPIDDETLSETTHALSMAGGAIWGTPGNNGAALMLGNTSQETCFLSGVTGSLVGNPKIPGIQGFLPASAEVFPSGGKWWVRTRAGVGPGVAAHVTCVNVPYPGSSHELNWSDNITSQGLPDAPNRHCFLRKVWATSGLNGAWFNNTQTNITLKKSNGWWTFHGSYVSGAGGDSLYGGATALCIDVPTSASWSFTLTGPTNANNSASTTITLKNYYPNGPGVPIANVGCWMTGIRGNWGSGSPNPLGWNNGVHLTRDATVSPYWQLTATNGRTGHVACIH